MPRTGAGASVFVTSVSPARPSRATPSSRRPSSRSPRARSSRSVLSRGRLGWVASRSTPSTSRAPSLTRRQGGWLPGPGPARPRTSMSRASASPAWTREAGSSARSRRGRSLWAATSDRMTRAKRSSTRATRAARTSGSATRSSLAGRRSRSSASPRRHLGQSSDAYLRLSQLQELADRAGRVNTVYVRADSSTTSARSPSPSR